MPQNQPAPTTLADAIAAVLTWRDLTDTRRRDLVSAISVTARMAGLPPASVALTVERLRPLLAASGSSCGITDASMRNLRSAMRAVLRRLDLIDATDGALSAAWQACLDLLPPDHPNALGTFARFASHQGIDPQQVTAKTFLAFQGWIETRTLTGNPNKYVGSVRSAWNRACRGIAAWPGMPVAGGRRHQYILPLDAFPGSFAEDLAAFVDRLGRSPLDDAFAEDIAKGEANLPSAPPRPLRPISVAARRDHVRWAASALIATGIPIEAITSLSALVTPHSRARDILRFLFRHAGQKPSAAGMHVAHALRMVARHHVGLDEPALADIRKWAALVTPDYRAMTRKNRAALAAIRQPERFAILLHLPEALLCQARRLRASDPLHAAGLARVALAIELLTKIPLRLKNLIGLRVDRHLHRADPRRGLVTAIQIDAEETKNNRAIVMPVSPATAAIIEEWTRDFRIMSPWLFPGGNDADHPITPQGMRDAIMRTTRRHVGVALTPHQFRHLAAMLYLEHCPGDYESVRQLLGHASLATTLRAYVHSESGAAAKRYDEMVLAQRRTLPKPKTRPDRIAQTPTVSAGQARQVAP